MASRERADRAGEPVAQRTETAKYMAEEIGKGFINHDIRNREAAIEAFANVDRVQFPKASEGTVRRASTGYVDALWAKDAVENACRVDGEIDQAALEAADWSPVEAGFRKRADAVDIAPAYATLSTEAWRRHKVGGDYWTPLGRAQILELRAVFDDPEYPHKPREGQSGPGPEAVRYLLGVELHDMERWYEGYQAMVPYYEHVLAELEATVEPPALDGV